MSNAMLMLTISTVAGIIQAVFWRWVSSISDARKEDSKKIEELSQRISALSYELYKEYQSKVDAHLDNQKILESLRELKTDVNKISEKLDKKVDK